MFEQRTRLIIQDKYMELVGIVIDELRNMPVQQVSDSIDVPFENVWDAFAEPFQHEAEPLYNSYNDVVSDMCQQLTEQLTLTELQLLWLVSDGALEWEDDDEFPDEEQMLNDVAEELYSWVEQEAEEPELADEYEVEIELDEEEDEPPRH